MMATLALTKRKNSISLLRQPMLIQLLIQEVLSTSTQWNFGLKLPRVLWARTICFPSQIRW
jgi:hypothetical protein